MVSYNYFQIIEFEITFIKCQKMSNHIYLIFITNFKIAQTIIHCLKSMNLGYDDPHVFCRPKHAFIIKKKHLTLGFLPWVFCVFFWGGGWVFCANPVF